MINTVKKYLESNKLNSKVILIGVSGGPDSICLLYLLNYFKLEFNLELKVAYINHGIRSLEENLLDYNTIKSHCQALNIPLFVKNIPAGEIYSISKQNKDSVEAVARNIRYNFFESCIEDDNYIAVGHNHNDQLETQIMRFFQGSTYEGLIGISNKNERVIRPLLNISRDSILEYLHDNSINYCIDKSNNETDFLRNKIRNKLVPVIKEIFPGYKTSLDNIKKNMEEIKFFVNNNSVMISWNLNESSFETNYADFISASPLQRKNEIYKIFNMSYNGNVKSYRLPKRFLLPLDKKKFNNNEVILEGHGFKLIRKSELLIWKPLN